MNLNEIKNSVHTLRRGYMDKREDYGRVFFGKFNWQQSVNQNIKDLYGKKKYISDYLLDLSNLLIKESGGTIYYKNIESYADYEYNDYGQYICSDEEYESMHLDNSLELLEKLEKRITELHPEYQIIN